MNTPSVSTETNTRPPSGRSRTRFEMGGKMIEVTLDWDHVRLLALNASRNKSGKSQAGPVVARRVEVK